MVATDPWNVMVISASYDVPTQKNRLHMVPLSSYRHEKQDFK